MGISLEFVGSMESEINTKHNKDIIGQGINCHVTDAKTETDSDVIIIDDAKASDTAAGGELHAPEMVSVFISYFIFCNVLRICMSIAYIVNDFKRNFWEKTDWSNCD